MGSRRVLRAVVKSTGSRPDHADSAVRLAASGCRPLDIRDRVDWDTPVCSLTDFHVVLRAVTVALKALKKAAKSKRGLDSLEYSLSGGAAAYR